MKTLLITGTLAENTVKQYAKQSQTPTEVLTLNVQVAAFLTPEIISQALKKHKLHDIDIILTPGQALGDTKIITDATKIPAFKGPRYAADLPVVLDSLGEVKLSSVVPADDLLRAKLEAKALEELEKVEQNREELFKKQGNLMIGDLTVGKELPMRVLAEIVDAPLLDTAEIARLAKHYVASGAHIIDIGMVAGQTRPQDAKRAVTAVKAAVDVPVSIDTLNPLEIEAAVAAGADLVLSADAGNLEEIAPFAKDVAVVVIPTNHRKGFFPKKSAERVRLLERLIKQAKQLGFKKIVGDLILEPTNIMDSYVAFQEFSRRNPEVPLLIGIANVVELFDADSVGLNALLARLASEVSADILLTTEETPKARGCVREVSVAAKMMFLAKRRNSVPRDLGLDLLVLKNKTEKEAPLKLGKTKIITAKRQKNKSVTVDSCGVFRVMVDRENKKLVALHYKSAEAPAPNCAVRGVDAETVMAEVLRLGLVSRLEHAAYLGGELAKAEVALRVGRDYVQDAVLFEK
ncbi:MAG: dihydropteroate synthase-like protein [Candidatus Bathyarchaeota archaeon]|nr:dihydropteroate synthase-like protein [Candidatus Bathyarchaeota archaeon]